MSVIKNSHFASSYGSILFCICFLSMIFQRFEGELGTAFRFAAVISSLLLAVRLINLKLISSEVVAVFIALSFFVLCNIFYTQAKEPLALMQIFIMAIMGLFLVQDGIKIGFARTIFWIVILSMILLYGASTNHENIFPGQGKNFCGAYALLSFFILAIALSSEDNDSSSELLIASLACLAVSIYATGRGSILSCAILVLLMILIKYRSLPLRSSKESFLICILLIGLISVSIALLTDFASTIFSRFGSLGAERSNEARMGLYSDFIAAATRNIETFIVGFNPNEMNNRVIILTGGNLHCSFFQWQANFGFIGTILLILYSTWGMIRLYKSRKYMILSACFSIYFRAITDTMLVGVLWDVVFFYLVFIVITKKKYRCSGNLFSVVHTRRFKTPSSS